MKKTAHACTERDAHSGADAGQGASLLLLVAFDIAALGAALWLALSIPEALDQAANARSALDGESRIVETKEAPAGMCREGACCSGRHRRSIPW